MLKQMWLREMQVISGEKKHHFKLMSESIRMKKY